MLDCAEIQLREVYLRNRSIGTMLFDVDLTRRGIEEDYGREYGFSSGMSFVPASEEQGNECSYNQSQYKWRCPYFEW
jgi:hypothetical protein